MERYIEKRIEEMTNGILENGIEQQLETKLQSAYVDVVSKKCTDESLRELRMKLKDCIILIDWYNGLNNENIIMKISKTPNKDNDKGLIDEEMTFEEMSNFDVISYFVRKVVGWYRDTPMITDEFTMADILKDVKKDMKNDSIETSLKESTIKTYVYNAVNNLIDEGKVKRKGNGILKVVKENK